MQATTSGKHATVSDDLEPSHRARDDVPDVTTSAGWNFRKEKKRYCIVCLMVLMWLTFTILMMINAEKTENAQHSVVSVPENGSRSLWLNESSLKGDIVVKLNGPFYAEYHEPVDDEATVWLEIRVERVTFSVGPASNPYDSQPADIQETEAISDLWTVALLPKNQADGNFIHELDKTLAVGPDYVELADNQLFRLLLSGSLAGGIGVMVDYELHPIEEFTGVASATALLVGLFVLIGFELVHRALAAVLAATMGVAVLAFFGMRPDMKQVMEWIDVETMLLLFSMMLIVAILTKTGIFDFLSVIAFQITRGQLWPMIFTLCVFAGVASSVIDVVTTVLLMTPVAIRLCEVLRLNPKPVLLAIIMACNMISSITPVGDPPNIIMAANADIQEAGVNFTNFVLHMGPGAIVCTLVLFLQLRYCFYCNATKLQCDEPTELSHEIEVWQRTASMLTMYTRDEREVRRVLDSRVRKLQAMRRDSDMSTTTLMSQVVAHHEHPENPAFDYSTLLVELRAKYPIRDKILLLKCCFVLTFAIVFFFVGHSVQAINLSLGTVAFLAATLLLILADTEDMDSVLGRVEWATLVFFAALFVLMEVLSELGLIRWVGKQMELVILSVSKEDQLLVALMLVLWVSAIASAFIESVPLMAMFLRIVVDLSKSPALLLPLQPLGWALAFGCCFGGNGTLVGSSANVVCTGVAEQHGYKITMWEFSKIGFPVMLVSICVISVYLILCHVVFSWNE